MPNWKKLITSGSAGSLASLSVDTSVNASSFTGSLQSTNGVISSSGNLVSGELVYSTGNSSVSSSNLIYLDTVNERVGIKTTTPQYPFHYVQDTGNALAVYEKQGGAAIFYEAQDTRGALGTVASHPLLFAINSAEVSRINTSGVYEGDLSGSLTGTASYADSATSASYAVSASHVEFADNTRNAVSASYADTASIALSGDGVFSGSFSGSFEGDGSNLTGVGAFPYTGSAGITGSLNLTGNANIIGGANFDVFATPQTASGDSIIPDGYYAKMFGPVLISGTVTVGTGSILKVEPF